MIFQNKMIQIQEKEKRKKYRDLQDVEKMHSLEFQSLAQ